MIDVLPNSPFTLKEVMHLEVTRYAVLKMVEEGSVEKISHGLYRKTLNKDLNFNFDTSMFERVYARSGNKGCICLWSALEFYDLTEEFIERAWIYVPYEKIIRVSDVRVVRKRTLNLEIGVVDMEQFKITSIERTLIDCLLSKKHITLRDSLEMCRKAISLKKTNLKKLVDMAHSLERYAQVEEYLGLL